MLSRLICLHALIFKTTEKIIIERGLFRVSNANTPNDINVLVDQNNGTSNVVPQSTDSRDAPPPVSLIPKYVREILFPEKSENSDENGMDLFIPDYQRGYCWKQEDVTGLFSSLLQWHEAVKEESLPFYIGTIILKEGKQNDQKEYAVIDGQQRLLTLAILLLVLSPSCEIGILNCPIGVTSENRSLESIQALKNAKTTLENLIKAQRMIGDNPRKDKFFDWLLQSVLVGVIIIGESQSEDLAYTFFSSTNATGKRLSDYDLLKTHHLRYLQTDSAQAKSAECWNKLSQTTCKRKDGTVYGVILTEVLHYSLFRLRHWCRGKGFDPSADTNQNRPIFKHFAVQRDLIALTELPLVPRMDSMLSGGSEFFNYMELYRVKMQTFDQHECVMELMSFLEWHSNGVLWRGIKAMLFMYYCKFGEWHLKEALFCIAYRLSILRNEGRVERRHYNTKGIFSECATVLDQATLSGEFFAWALARDAMYTPDRSTPTKNRYWDSLKDLLRGLKGSDSTFAIEKQTEEVLWLFSVQTTT